MKYDWEKSLIEQMYDDESVTTTIDSYVKKFLADEMTSEELGQKLRIIKLNAESDHEKFPSQDCDCNSCRRRSA